jgi:hypothetical protein
VKAKNSPVQPSSSIQAHVAGMILVEIAHFGILVSNCYNLIMLIPVFHKTKLTIIIIYANKNLITKL